MSVGTLKIYCENRSDNFETKDVSYDDNNDYDADDDVIDDNYDDNAMKPGQVGKRVRPSLPQHLLPGLLQVTSSSP